METKSQIEFSIEDQLATLLLNAPERHNALTPDDLKQIEFHMTHLEELVSQGGANSPRVLIITGAGEQTFCAGAALGDVEKGLHSGNIFQNMVDHIEQCSVPTIGALNGSLYGGGVELALACDFRIGVHGSKLLVPAAKLGICYPYEGIQRFISRLGLSLSKRLLMANETLDANAAYSAGIFDHLVSNTELMPFALSLAKQLSQLAPLSVQGMKQTLNEIAKGEGNQEMAKNREEICLKSKDMQEGLAAQRQKREAEFLGE